MATHYVNNAEMLDALKKHKVAVDEAKANGLPLPRIPEYIGECILKIANRLSRKANFMNYSYREDMVLDGIENCMQCINSFDPAKSSNPFSYFTQVIYFAFLRRIAKEKKQTYIKGRMIQDVYIDSFDVQEHDEDAEFKNAYVEFMKTHQNFDDSFIKKKQKKVEKKNHNLETFFEETVEASPSVEDIIEELGEDLL